MELRVIGAGALESLTLLYVDHHDAAYRWAESRTPVLSGSGALVELVETSITPGTTSTTINAAQRAAYVELGLPDFLATHLATLDDTQVLDALETLSPEYQELALSIAAGEAAPRPRFQMPDRGQDKVMREAAEVAGWARLVTRRVVGQFLEAIARSPALRRLYIVSPWISEVEDTARYSLAQLRKRLVDENATAYVVTRPPTTEWHRDALEAFRETRRANVVLAESLHSKLFCADTGARTIALFGSANFTQQSLVNREVGLLVHDFGDGRHIVRQLVQEAAEIYRTIPDRQFFCRLKGG